MLRTLFMFSIFLQNSEKCGAPTPDLLVKKVTNKCLNLLNFDK